jgi:hypothetical protein
MLTGFVAKAATSNFQLNKSKQNPLSFTMLDGSQNQKNLEKTMALKLVANQLHWECHFIVFDLKTSFSELDDGRLL